MGEFRVGHNMSGTRKAERLADRVHFDMLIGISASSLFPGLRPNIYPSFYYVTVLLLLSSCLSRGIYCRLLVFLCSILAGGSRREDTLLCPRRWPSAL